MTVKKRLNNLLKKAPISLSEYISICLYDDQDGYYTTHIPIGREGDFTTAPEISQLFGEMIALWALNYSKNQQHNLVELGPGKGTLLKDIFRVSRKYNIFKYYCVEISPELRSFQQQTLKQVNCQWAKDLQELKQELDIGPCIFIANEFFDAFPIDQYIFKSNKWHKKYVVSENDTYNYADIPIKDIPRKYIKNYPIPKEGDILEYSPKQEETLTTILALIQKAGGALICIDYGYAECGYGNTFQALKDHKYIDPLLYQGQADLTSHVNFSFFSNIAEEKGFEVTIYTQSEFLKMMGIELRYQILCKQKPEHQKILQQGLDRLINKMGYLFKVMVIKSNGKSKK